MVFLACKHGLSSGTHIVSKVEEYVDKKTKFQSASEIQHPSLSKVSVIATKRATSLVNGIFIA